MKRKMLAYPLIIPALVVAGLAIGFIGTIMLAAWVVASPFIWAWSVVSNQPDDNPYQWCELRYALAFSYMGWK